MSKEEKVYETVALVKAIEVCKSKCAIKFHPVKKYSIDQHFLCLEIKAPQADQCFSEIEKEAVSIEGTCKLLKDISITLDDEKQKFEVLKVAALKALPVRIQFAKEQNQSEDYKLCNVRVDF